MNQKKGKLDNQKRWNKGNPFNHIIKIPVSANQKERIKMIAEQRGYSTLSSFGRELLLANNDISINQKLNQILAEIKTIGEDGDVDEEGD
jgi:hypothetical protein